MTRIKNMKKIAGLIALFSLTASLTLVGNLRATATETSTDNQMLHFVMKVRWGNVIGEPENISESSFDGSISTSDNARISLERKLLFEKHNDNTDKITQRRNPVSWTSLIYNHWDGVKVLVSSPGNDSVVINIPGQGSITKTARELYNMNEPYIKDVGNGREIVVKVYPVKNPKYFLKIIWGKTSRTDYALRSKIESDEVIALRPIAKRLVTLHNASGSLKIDDGGTLKLVKKIRFEGRDRITSQTDTQIDWTSYVARGVDGILVKLKLNTKSLSASDTVTLNFTEANWSKNFSIVGLYHDKITTETIKNGYGVILQVWRKPNRSLIRIKNKPTVYMIEDGIKQPIPSEEVLFSQGLTFDDVEVVEQDEADTYADGDAVNYADGTIVQEEGKPEVYVIENGEKKHIQDPKAFVSLGYSWNNIVKVKPGILGLYRKGAPLKSNSTHPEGALIRVAGTPTVYLIKGGRRVPIPSIQLFNAYRFDWNKVLVVSERQKNKFKQGNILKYPDGSLLRSPSGKVYKIDQRKKRWIRSGDDFKKAGYRQDKIIDVNDNEIDSFEEGNDIVADDIVD
jgi:hypothetical protein